MLIRGAARDLRRMDGCRKWSPARLFAAGEQGVWYDPSDLSTLFQDAAGTTPVTAVGQPVGRMLDKSGRGNHATQPTAQSRPLLQQDANGKYHLAFDGSSYGMLTGSINFTATDKMTVFAGVKKLSDSATGIIVELSPVTALNAGSFYLGGPLSAAGTNYGFLSRGTIDSSSPVIASGAVAPNASIVSAISMISPSSMVIRRNGTQAFASTANQGSGNYGNYPLFIGRRNNASLPFNGNLYGLIIRGAQTSLPDIIRTERILAGKSGITF